MTCFHFLSKIFKEWRTNNNYKLITFSPSLFLFLNFFLFSLYLSFFLSFQSIYLSFLPSSSFSSFPNFYPLIQDSQIWLPVPAARRMSLAVANCCLAIVKSLCYMKLKIFSYKFCDKSSEWINDKIKNFCAFHKTAVRESRSISYGILICWIYPAELVASRTRRCRHLGNTSGRSRNLSFFCTHYWYDSSLIFPLVLSSSISFNF